MATAIERVHGGEIVHSAPPAYDGKPGDDRRWPGQDSGLSERPSEILALISHDLSNKEIAQSLFLGQNTVKTYIRSLYQ
ncbi:LuxR family transcriptional regulator [Nocardioides mangrovicus]|uniref:LuxR family transcriptional regulator n=1 Tax=Nocardioides mangrovicus TaxID=2478913 RepID=A0A3L8P719_9ACTN|nr:helix-turn-helix transcriptional regulator [Nocardioides mangrovicus]RLV50914.1 LuxR family transcriptional regulator [Nocardioides mangrovicus]